MKINKFLITACLIVSIILSIFTNVYAADMKAIVKLTLDSSSSYKVGEEIVLNVSIDVEGFDGILFFYANVDYPKEALEYIGATPEKGWGLNNDSDDNVYIEKGSITNGKGQICKLTFKVLRNDIDATIQLKDIDASGTNGSVLYLDGNVNSPTTTLKGITKPVTPPTKPDDTKPDDTKPDDTKPDDTKPDDTKPDDTKPDDTKPDDTKPGDTKPDDTKPDDTKPDDKKPDNTKPDNKKPTNNKDNTVANNKIPKTGSIAFGIIIIPFAIVAIFLLIKYIRLAIILK